MSSLVSYEDSEDESVDQASASVQTHVSCEHETRVACSPSDATSLTPDSEQTLLELNENVSELSNSSHQPQSQQHSRFKRDGDRTAEETQCTPAAHGKIVPLQTLPHMPQRFSDGLNQVIRRHTVPSAVRPYIPKRRRLATSVETAEPKSSLEQVPANKTQERQILSDASERLKPYLGHKAGAAGIPRRLHMSLGGHQGPVNTVQWCPVPHLSHLLLSAAMDKTFKVQFATS